MKPIFTVTKKIKAHWLELLFAKIFGVKIVSAEFVGHVGVTATMYIWRNKFYVTEFKYNGA